MTDEEIEWVDNYHATVFERLAPSLTDAERVWLKAATAPLNR